MPRKPTANGTTFLWRATCRTSIPGLHGRDHTTRWSDTAAPGQCPGLGRVSDDHVLGRIAVGSDFTPYTLPIPPALAAAAGTSGTPVRIKLVTNVWRPKVVLGVPDDRDLGVMVDRVDVK